MRWHPRAITALLRGRLRSLVSRDDVEREFDEEMRFHLDMEVEKNVRAGMAPAEARRAAVLSFGGMDRMVEDHRDARGTRFIEDAIGDVRYAARTLGRTPGFVVVSVLTLSVAIAIGTLAFTAANAFVYRPLPLPDGARLLSLFTSDWSDPKRPGASSYADVVDIAREVESIADVAGESRIMLTFAVNDEVTYAQGAVVTSRYFHVARVQPVLGQFSAATDVPSLVISHSLWRRAFGADPSVVGRPVRTNGQPFVVAAVAPPEFRGINRENGVDFWVDGEFSPIVLLRDDLITRRGNRSFRVAGRLLEGQSLAALNARLEIVAAQLYRTHPEAWRDTTGGGRVVTAMREQEAHLAGIPRTGRWLLIAAVVGLGLGLLVVACTNLASMQMARGASRRREIATRLALGAGRGRVIRQLLAECALVAVPGIIAGVVLALIISGLTSYYRPIPLPSWDLALDWRAAAFISGGLALTLLVFGLLPALQTVRADLIADLKGGEQVGADGLRIGSVRGGLIVAQVAMSMVFTASAGLVVVGLGRQANEARGDAANVLVTRINFLPAAGDSSQVEALLADVLDGVRAIPGVQAVSAASFIPVRGSRMTVYGETRSKTGELKQRELDGNYIRPGYLGLMDIPLLRGRDFEPRDIGPSPVVIVSKGMGDALWPGEDPIGQLVRINGREVPATVIGVAADPPGFVPATDHSYPGLLYLPLPTGREAEVNLHIRAPGSHGAIAAQSGELLRRYGTQMVAPKPITLDEYYDRMLLPLRLIARGSGALATLQFLLAVAGVSGLVAYVTTLRRREIGIRTALGATRRSVLLLVIRQAVRLTVIGGAIGLAVSVMVARLVADSLPVTPAVLAAGLLIGVMVIGLVGLVAMLVPARRALDVSPAAALRID